MATIKDVAAVAGVSSAMVSRYLNDGYVAAEKRPLIAAAIEQCGYRPSQQARNLRTGKSSLVGVVVPKISSEAVARAVAGVEQVLRAHGYQMLLANTGNDAEAEVDFLELFESYPADGLVLVGTAVTDRHEAFFAAAGVPVVVVGQRVRGVDCVYHDDRGAAFELARRLGAARPDARFAYVGVDEADRAVGVERRDGFLDGLAASGVAVPDGLMATSPFTVEGGHRTVAALLDACAARGGSVDFISCATDIIAAGAIRAVLERWGTRPGTGGAPGVSGFGDNELVRAVSGGIPTVHLGYRTSGVRGAELLVAAMAGGREAPAEECLGYRVVGV